MRRRCRARTTGCRRCASPCASLRHRCAGSLGITHYVEIGPHPVLCAAGIECLGAGRVARVHAPRSAGMDRSSAEPASAPCRWCAHRLARFRCRLRTLQGRRADLSFPATTTSDRGTRACRRIHARRHRAARHGTRMCGRGTAEREGAARTSTPQPIPRNGGSWSRSRRRRPPRHCAAPSCPGSARRRLRGDR